MPRWTMAVSAVITDTDTLTVTFAFTPTCHLSGKQHNLYLRAADAGGLDGWNDHGDWIINRAPDWLVPPSLINTTVLTSPLLFRSTLPRPGRLAEPRSSLFRHRPQLANRRDGVKAVYLKYDQVDNKVYLADDGGTAWLGGLAPGTTAFIENSMAKVVVEWSKPGIQDAKTRVMRWRLEFKAEFVGARNVYMRAIDQFPVNGDTGWKWKGTLAVVP